jgi:signal transduction histidine kinase
VAQEALTNTLRHAGPGARARLEVRYEPHALTVLVTDDGGERAGAADRRPTEPPGHGIVGMRERVALFGGSLEAGPLHGRGYRVIAVFPVENKPDAGALRDDAGERTGPREGSA